MDAARITVRNQYTGGLFFDTPMATTLSFKPSVLKDRCPYPEIDDICPIYGQSKLQ